MTWERSRMLKLCMSYACLMHAVKELPPHREGFLT